MFLCGLKKRFVVSGSAEVEPQPNDEEIKNLK
jgi:hypothetical protein